MSTFHKAHKTLKGKKGISMKQYRMIVTFKSGNKVTYRTNTSDAALAIRQLDAKQVIINQLDGTFVSAATAI
jgi:hypothetical protein